MGVLRGSKEVLPPPIELFNLNKSYVSDLYTAHRKVTRCSFRIPARIHNPIVIKLAGVLVSKLDCRIAKFIFNMLNHDNDTVPPSLEVNFIALDHVRECRIVSPKIIYVLLGELCTE